MRFTALNKITEQNKLAILTAERNRNKFKETGVKFDRDAMIYADGEAAAFNVAYKIMKQELEQLRLKFQNGYLSIDDFNTDDYVAR